MTYRNTARNTHFQSRTGNSSQTGYANAWAVGGNPIDILPTLKDQYEGYKLKIHECDLKLNSNSATTAEREQIRKQMAEAARHMGNLREVLQAGSRFAFEATFVQVANYRLPKDKFLALVEEAREIWRADGYADFVPPPTHDQLRRTAKRARHNGWRST
jgi:hypothetical protein